MNTSPKFSICIPTIGRCDLIKTAVKSLKKQTCQDFEIIIGDSHQNEDIVRFVDELKDPRIRVVHPPEDAGAFSPWDYPPRFARGEYIMWLDDDNCLLPFTLELFADAIKRTHADIITGNHVYYYDSDHPKPHLQRSFGVVPFTEDEYSIDLDVELRRVFSFSRRLSGKGRPRFHLSTTVISQEVIKKAYKRLGHMVFPDLPHMDSIYPILFTLARTCHFIDRPVAVIGRLGVSMGQSWSTSARKRFECGTQKPACSPLSAYTRINSFYDVCLYVHRALPEYLDRIPVDEGHFAEIHLKELFLLDTNVRTLVRNWYEFFIFLKRINKPLRTRLLWKGAVYASAVPLVFLSRRLRLHYLRRIIASKLTTIKEREKQPEKSWNREFSIPLPEGVEYNTITGVADRVPELVFSITGRDIAWHPPFHKNK